MSEEALLDIFSSRGAKNLILLSRSGTKSKEAINLVHGLMKGDAEVATNSSCCQRRDFSPNSLLTNVLSRGLL